MKIKLIFYLCAVVFVIATSAAAQQQKRRRPVVDTSAQDSDGNYVDQIALDSVNYASPSQTVAAPENYPANFYTGKKPKKPTLSSEQKIQYVTPEIYSAPPKVTHENYPQPSAGIEYTYINRTEARKSSTTPRQKQKAKDDYADYNYYFPESKRINAKTPAKASTSPNVDQFYQPQSSSSFEPVVRKEVSKNGEELTYHYYYPEESTHDEQKSNIQSFPSSTTFSPSTTRSPAPSSSFSYSTKKKNPLEHTSTDAYQYPPVLQRPNEYDLIGSEAPHESFYSTYESPKTIKSHSTITPQSTATPVKILKPTKKNNYYLPSSTLSPSTTARQKIRRPSTDSPFTEIKKFSLPPSVTSTMVPHYSTTTRAPELYAYSTVSPVSSTVLNNEFYIKPSTQVTPTVSSSSSGDLYSDGSNERTVVIKPKVQYTHTENYDQQQQQPTVKETIVYKYVDPQDYYGGGNFEANKTTNESEMYYTPTSDSETAAKTPEYYKELNQSVQADMDFYNDFHKNYNYQYFTEQDAGSKMTQGEDKMDGNIAEDEEEAIDEKQRASKKNMMFSISPEPRYQSSSMIPVNLQDHEVPPPMTDSDSENDLTSEASKNHPYFVFYSVDDEQRDNRDNRDSRETRKEKKYKKKVRPTDSELFYQHHQQQQQQQLLNQQHQFQQQQQQQDDRDYEDEFQQFDTEFDSEFDSDVIHSDNVRIVDPAVRGGRPIEFTKDDYLRHIKQAVVQYMKNIQVTKEPNLASSTPKAKITKYQENNHDSLLRPTKASLPSAIVSSTAAYKNTLSPQQYKPLTSLKLPKNIYTADRLKEAIEDIQESPQIDLTVNKKNKLKPFDLSAIDVGQTYQHVTHFDHSAALKNVEEFDQSNVMTGSNGGGGGGGNKQKLHFSQQTYHDINNLGHNQKQKLSDDSDNDNTNTNLFKGYVLPKQYQAKLVTQQNNQANQNTFSAMNYDASKLPRIVSQQQQHNIGNNNGDDDEDENKVDETIDAPIQIINGIPVANPYNIDLNTLKYMLGGIAQAEVNDQIRDLDESQSQKVTNSWKGLSGQFTSQNPIYQVYGQQQQQQSNKNENSSQKQKKNNNNSNNNSNKQAKFPLVGQLLNFNKLKGSGNKQRNVKNTINIQDYSNWSHANKKQRTEVQPSQSQNVFVVRPLIRNKQARDDRKSLPPPRLREPAREMRPPPMKQKAPLFLTRLN